MNRIFFFAAALLLCSACDFPSDGFVVRGNFPGLQDGMTVLIRNVENERYDTIAWGLVQRGAFELRGAVRTPQYVELQIHNEDITTTPENVKLVNTFLFLDNSDLTLKTAHLDSMGYVQPSRSESAELKICVEGGLLQREFYEYRAALLPLQLMLQRFSDSLTMMTLWEYRYTPAEYLRLMDEWHAQKQAAEAAVDDFKMDFICRHPHSPLSLYVAEGLLKTTFVRTPEEVEELKKMIGQMDDTIRCPYLLKIAEVTETLCKGADYKDVELTDSEGKTVRLSQFVRPGCYTLLDFWASWCGPCRWAIPKVKQLYSRYDRDAFTVLSVSLDQNKADWEKAMKDEEMPWPQLGINGQEQLMAVGRSYNITGIPRLILLDPEGKIVFSGHDAEALRIAVEKFLGK